jgi:extracellular factor (EF) 3-hydroxypalmitic acid methyl ester biosynthesis protein
MIPGAAVTGLRSTVLSASHYGGAPGARGRGYMEGMMGWSLIYRSEAELEVLFEPNRERRVYRDEPGNVVYLGISPHWS